MVGAGVAFGVSKIPGASGFLANILTKIPFVSRILPGGVLGAAIAGAVVGGVLGLVGGLRKAKADAAAYAEQQAAAAAPVDPAAGAPVDTPVGTAPTTPTPAPSGVKKNPVMGSDYKNGTAVKGASAKPGTKYHIKSGDTLWALSRKYGVSIDAIVKANPKIKDPDLIYAGDTITIPKKKAA
jgi:spore coat assembly protein SafA